MTPRRSVRAEARRLYREMVGEGGLSPNSQSPSADAPPPRAEPVIGPAEEGGTGRLAAEGQHALRGEGAQPLMPDPPSLRFGGQDLMAQVRRLYEDSIIPVRDIAQRAGVTERTLYKYARKQNWKPRYAWMPDGSRPPARPGRRRWTQAQEKQQARAEQFAPGQGAGGRFIRREEIGTPFAQGIKAVDAAGRAAAAKASAEAARMAQRARVEAQFERALSNNCEALRALRRAADEARLPRAPRRAPSNPLSARIEASCIDALLAWVNGTNAALEEAGVAMLAVAPEAIAPAPVTSACSTPS